MARRREGRASARRADHGLIRTFRALSPVLGASAGSVASWPFLQSGRGACMAPANYHAYFGTRFAQAFPVLADDEIERMRRFGEPRHFAAGQKVYATGQPSPGLLVVLRGTIHVTGRDGHGHDIPVVEHTRGSFSGEIGQL